MDKNKAIQKSKLLSLVLRHQPQKIGLNLDVEGWAEVAELLEKIQKLDKEFDKEALDFVVENNDKKRFRFDETGKKIKASQGHSIQIQSDFEQVVPPNLLFHGTTSEAIPSIKKTGLQKMKRHHVHLSKDKETAVKVGQRRKGELVILKIKALDMHNEGTPFFLSDNGVWLVEEVPTSYIDFPK